MKQRTHDFTQGPIFQQMMLFALPILISNIFQQLYNMADTIIVGHFLGEKALAAVGSTTAIFDLIVGFALGVGNGMGVVIARYYGAKDFTMVKKAVAATLVIGACMSLVVMIVGQLGLYPLLELLGTPDHIIQQAYDYIYLILMCIGVTFSYNLGAGLLRAIGDSLTALYFLIFSAALNVVLDLYFISVLQMGVRSAGIATIISQGLSALLCFFYIRKRVGILVPEKQHFGLHKPLYMDLLAQGFATGLVSSIVSIGTLILQTSINALGVSIIAAQTAARRIMYLSILPMSAMGATMMTFTSQNFGAHTYDRIRKAFKLASICVLTWGALAAIVLYFASPTMTGLLSGSDKPEIVHNATLYLRISSVFYPVLGILFLCNGTLQGLGRKIIPMTSSFLELLGKWTFVLFVIPSMGYLGVICCEPTLWVLMVLFLASNLRAHPVFSKTKSASL